MPVPSEKCDAGKFEPSMMPFVAPCNKLDSRAPFRWLKKGWEDIRIAPKQSLTYGFILMVLAYAVAFLAYKMHSFIIMVALLSGFMFLGPVLAIGLYSISCQIQNGRKPVLGYCLREGKKHLGNEMVFAVILMVVFLLWMRATSTVHIFFPVEANPEWSDLAVFLGVGTLIGAIFSGIIFCASAFSLPMFMDRKVDVVTAVVTSINAVLRNKLVLLLWGFLIVFFSLLGFLTGTLLVLLPLIGHATWHAYQETINADAWPRHCES
jgi:uncharacterized membrane protein